MKTNEQIRNLIKELVEIRSDIIKEQAEFKSANSEWLKCEIQIENLTNVLKTLRERIQ